MSLHQPDGGHCAEPTEEELWPPHLARNTEHTQRNTFEHKPRVGCVSGMRGMHTSFKFVGDGIKEGKQPPSLIPPSTVRCVEDRMKEPI